MEDLGTVPRKVTVKPGTKEAAMFAQTRRDELNGLVQNGTFRPIKRSDVPNGSRIFNARFVDEIKRAGEGLRKKSRLVSQSYSDEEATTIPTKAPTVQRLSQRTALSIAASDDSLEATLRDIIQAYIQALSNLMRRVFIHAPKEMELGDDYVLEVIKPLYGIPESGLHWYLTYLDHHTGTLGMNRSNIDPCVLCRRTESGLDGIVLLQVDDSLGFGTPQFLADEEKGSSKFNSKPRTTLTEKPTSFNGITLRRFMGTVKCNIYVPKSSHTRSPASPSTRSDTATDTHSQHISPIDGETPPTRGKIDLSFKVVRKQLRYRMTQEDKIRKMQLADTRASFISARALSQYIGVNTRPDTCAPIQLIAPGIEPPSRKEIKLLQKITLFMKDTIGQGLDYVQLDMDSARIVLVTDASFANTRDLKSQLGYLVLIVDGNGFCNILHYASNRSKRIARSVMAAELLALVLGFDNAYIIRELVLELTGRRLVIDAVIDSITVFDVIAKRSQTTEKRLQIDVLSLRENHDRGDLDNFGWLPGHLNAADPLTKYKLSLVPPPSTRSWLLIVSTFVSPVGLPAIPTLCMKKKVAGVSIVIDSPGFMHL